MRRRKFDVMTVLAALIALGVLTTGLVQGAIREANVPTLADAQK